MIVLSRGRRGRQQGGGGLTRGIVWCERIFVMTRGLNFPKRLVLGEQMNGDNKIGNCKCYILICILFSLNFIFKHVSFKYVGKKKRRRRKKGVTFYFDQMMDYYLKIDFIEV